MNTPAASAPGTGDPAPERPRFFTLEEANRTLPLVRRIVQDIVDVYPAFQQRLETFQRMAAEAGPQLRERLETLRAEIDREAERVNDFLRELQQIGCHFKGFQEGLVDFYSMRDGRPVFLCWRLGEERITHWHEIDAGFAGRQPIEPETAPNSAG